MELPHFRNGGLNSNEAAKPPPRDVYSFWTHTGSLEVDFYARKAILDFFSVNFDAAGRGIK